MRFLLSLLLLAGPVLAVEPSVGAGAFQPLSSDMHGIYRLMPGACLGVRLPRTGTMAFRAGAAGFYGSGSGDYGELRLASAALELGVELRTRSALGAYVVPAILVGYAAERTQEADTLGHIYDHWDSGTSLGFGLNGGAVIFKSGRLRLDAEAGYRFLSVPTGREPYEYLRYYPYYSSAIEASTFGVGLVLRFAPPEPESERE
jgi:hypothetical protein